MKIFLSTKQKPEEEHGPTSTRAIIRGVDR